ncbi:MAG TPA: gamma-glutamyl-gamma-aminobutyrate hydrolase family protein [Terriglobales bacterium]|nr:gamma-glutamyl-gamma-aminobutyrate hydrolase family protein [Terriglobales bacterium]
MKPRVAIPVPHSLDPDYAKRALPQYLQGIEAGGGTPVVIALDLSPDEIAKKLAECDAVLLPGSRADIDPSKYGEPRHPRTAETDARRDMADELLLQDAYNVRKPILGICYGMQMLNVYQTGTLVQDIPEQVKSPINHSAGRAVPKAHSVAVEAKSKLAGILGPYLDARGELVVNSSHHQAAAEVGTALRVVARCPDDQVIEAVEGVDPEHFVLGVQWHPERTLEEPASVEIFRRFIQAATAVASRKS